jgi:hypothetical protein
MSANRSAHLLAVEKLQSAAANIEEGRVLSGFVERSLKRFIDDFVEIVLGLDPKGATEEQFEQVDHILSWAITELESMTGHDEALARLIEAREWIAQGFSPSRPPAEEEIERLAQERAAVAMWGEPETT